MSFTKAIILGNMTRDPETKPVGGSSVTAFTLATNRRYKTAAGEQREDAAFIDCEAWGKQGEVIAQHFNKGKPILIEGEIRQDNWEDKESGAKRSKLKVSVTGFSFVGGKQDNDTGGGYTKAAKPEPAIDHDSFPF